MSNEEDDYVSAAERHNQIMDEGDDAVQGLGCALLLVGDTFLICACLFSIYILSNI
jgi:hypothetical protein